MHPNRFSSISRRSLLLHASCRLPALPVAAHPPPHAHTQDKDSYHVHVLLSQALPRAKRQACFSSSSPSLPLAPFSPPAGQIPPRLALFLGVLTPSPHTNHYTTRTGHLPPSPLSHHEVPCGPHWHPRHRLRLCKYSSEVDRSFIVVVCLSLCMNACLPIRMCLPFPVQLLVYRLLNTPAHPSPLPILSTLSLGALRPPPHRPSQQRPQDVCLGHDRD